MPFPSQVTMDVTVKCSAWEQIPATSKRKATITLARAEEAWSINLPDIKYLIGTIASGSFIELETSDVFEKYFENKVPQGILAEGTCTCFIPKGGMAITYAYYDNIPCVITYYRGNSKNIRIYVSSNNGVNSKLTTFFGTANLGNNLQMIGLDTIKFFFTPLETTEEDQTTDAYPEVQVLANVAAIETVL